MLDPAERLAFVLHDMFAVPFDEIAPMVERSPDATRQLASRARRRVQGAEPPPDADAPASARSSTPSSPPRAAATSTALVAVLDPDVVLRSDGGTKRAGCLGGRARRRERGEPGDDVRDAADRAAPGARERRGRVVVVVQRAAVLSVMGFTVRDGRIVAIDALADPERLAELDLSAVD